MGKKQYSLQYVVLCKLEDVPLKGLDSDEEQNYASQQQTANSKQQTANSIELRSLEHGLTVPFLRLAGRLKLNTAFVMDNRLT